MTVRNGADYLRETLDAIAAQTFTNYELIINDNGSTDDTPVIVDSYAKRDSRIRRTGIAPGEPSTFTQGIARALAAAKSPLVAVNDSDDVSDHARLEKQVAVFDREPDVVLVASAYDHIDESGRHIAHFALPLSHAEIVSELQSRGIIAHSTVMYRRDRAIAAGGYLQRMTFASDTALWVNMLKNGGRVAVVPEALVRIRQHAAQTSLMPGQQAQRYLEPLEILGMAATLPGVPWPVRMKGMLSRQKLALRYGVALWQSGRRTAGVVGAGYEIAAALCSPLRHALMACGRTFHREPDTKSEGEAR